mgnify:CR=1 FL=1|tara:strand:+ start:223 stop:1173 length:951 start_codon:yes stop_codon:yes gene_type:complete
MSENDTSGYKLLKPIMYVMKASNAVTKPAEYAGSMLGKAWADNVNGGIPETSQMFLDAIDDHVTEALVKELQSILEDPEKVAKLQSGDMLDGIAPSLAKGMAVESGIKTVIAKEPTLGLGLSAFWGGMNAAENRVTLYRNFMNMAGGVSPETARPNIPGFASIPFIDGADNQEYTVLIDAGHTLGDFVAGDGHCNEILYYMVDKNGNPAPDDVVERLNSNETFRANVLEPAMYDAYTDMIHLMGENMLDGHADKEEYRAYVKSVIENDPAMQDLAEKLVDTALRDRWPQLYEGEPVTRLQDSMKQTILGTAGSSTT